MTRPASAAADHRGSHITCHTGMAEPHAVTHLVGGGLRIVIRQAAEPEEATGLGSVEVGDVVVVRAVDRRERLVVGDAAVREEPARDPDDAVDDLGLDAVALLILATLGGIRGPGLRAGGEAGVREDAAAPSARHAW